MLRSPRLQPALRAPATAAPGRRGRPSVSCSPAAPAKWRHPSSAGAAAAAATGAAAAARRQRRRGLAPVMMAASVAAAAAAAAAGGPTDVLVLDFDGVLADSEVEVSTSAYESAQQLWPALFNGLGDGERARVMAGLKAARPRLIKGWESIAMARLVLEDEGNLALILQDWETLLPATLARWGEDEGRLSGAFEARRAARLVGAPEEWIALNPLFEGIKEALQECPYPFYLASSKAAGRLVSLLRSSLGMDVDEDSPRIFAALLPPNERKIAALREVMGRPVAAGGATLHFVDDRYETLEAIVQTAPDVAARYQLYLAAWGYNTAEERAAAAALPGVTVLRLPQMLELLRWGVVMGVDDGCEPTAEEAAENVR